MRPFCSRGLLLAVRRRFFPAPKRKNMRKRPPRVAVFPASGRPWFAPRAMRLVGARPPLSLLVRRRDGSRPERGLVWSVCAWFPVLVCCLCALVCGEFWARPFRRWSLVGVRWPRSVEGAVWLRRPVVGGFSLAAGKIANECIVVAVPVVLGVHSSAVRGWVARAGGAAAPHRARGAARSAALT